MTGFKSTPDLTTLRLVHLYGDAFTAALDSLRNIREQDARQSYIAPEIYTAHRALQDTENRHAEALINHLLRMLETAFHQNSTIPFLVTMQLQWLMQLNTFAYAPDQSAYLHPRHFLLLSLLHQSGYTVWATEYRKEAEFIHSIPDLN